MIIVFAVLAAVFAILAVRAYLTAPIAPPPVQYPARTAPEVIVSSLPAARCYRVYWLDAASVVPQAASPGLPAAWRGAVAIILPCQ